MTLRNRTSLEMMKSKKLYTSVVNMNYLSMEKLFFDPIMYLSSMLLVKYSYRNFI